MLGSSHVAALRNPMCKAGLCRLVSALWDVNNLNFPMFFCFASVFKTPHKEWKARSAASFRHTCECHSCNMFDSERPNRERETKTSRTYTICFYFLSLSKAGIEDLRQVWEKPRCLQSLSLFPWAGALHRLRYLSCITVAVITFLVDFDFALATPCNSWLHRGPATQKAPLNLRDHIWAPEGSVDGLWSRKVIFHIPIGVFSDTFQWLGWDAVHPQMTRACQLVFSLESAISWEDSGQSEQSYKLRSCCWFFVDWLSTSQQQRAHLPQTKATKNRWCRLSSSKAFLLLGFSMIPNSQV